MTAKEFNVSPRVVFESFNAQSKGLCFQSDRDGEIIQCGIAGVALRDLIDFHRVKSKNDEALRWLVIWPVDLLRYGYQGRNQSAA
jgi:hypothetical protein